MEAIIPAISKMEEAIMTAIDKVIDKAFVPAIIIFLISGTVVGYYFILYSLGKPARIRQALKDYATYNEKTTALVLHQRSPKLARYFRIVDAVHIDVSYKPETLHIGAVTVGGVTTGGTYKTGGYHYISGMHKNGKYNLEYTRQYISIIELNDALYQKALQSPIKAYLNKEKQIAVSSTTYDQCKAIMDWITLSHS